MGTNVFIPKEDVTNRLPDGRRILICPAGRPMTMDRAIALGLVVPARPVVIKPAFGPSELKEGVENATDGVNATSSAVQYAILHGVDLSGVEGTGQDGRILKHDVEAYLDADSLH